MTEQMLLLMEKEACGKKWDKVDWSIIVGLQGH